MNPVIGLDVAKGESQVQAFLDKKKSYKKSFKVSHTLEGLAILLKFIREIEDVSGVKPPIVLESTGHYHTPIMQYFGDRGYLLIVVNPLISFRTKSSSLRKVKTDVIDSHHLCELYYNEELEPYKQRGIQFLNLRNLTRQHENITGMFVQAKLQYQAILDQVFPEYCGVFGNLYSDVSLMTLQAFPTSNKVLEAGEQIMAKRIKELCKSRSQEWANSKAERLVAAAQRNPFQKTLYHSLILSLNMYINMIQEYKKHLSKLEDEIDVITKSIEEFRIIQSILESVKKSLQRLFLRLEKLKGIIILKN